jgi:hypothetical protein
MTTLADSLPNFVPFCKCTMSNLNWVGLSIMGDVGEYVNIVLILRKLSIQVCGSLTERDKPWPDTLCGWMKIP